MRKTEGNMLHGDSMMDNSFISLFRYRIFIISKLTLLRESPWFLSRSSVVKKAQKNTLGSKRKRVW